MDKNQLPSDITDQPYILLSRSEEEYFRNRKLRGKWMVKGNSMEKDFEGFTELDRFFLGIKELFEDGKLFRVKCDTGCNKNTISCYTLDACDVCEALNVAERLCKKLKYQRPLYYVANARCAGDHDNILYKFCDSMLFIRNETSNGWDRVLIPVKVDD